MARHFFLCSAVPNLSIEQKPAMNFELFIHMLELSCSKHEWKKVLQLRGFFDLMNLQALLYNRPLQPYGSISPDSFEEHLRQHLGLPDIVNDYLTHYNNNEERKAHFPALVAAFFDEKKKHSGFVGEYFAWLEEFFIVGGTIRAKHEHRDIAKELGDEDFSHPLVLEGLAYRDAMSYEPPQRFLPVKEIYERDFEDPKACEKNTSNFIFQHLEEIKEQRPFSIDYLLAYMVQLILVEHLWPEEEGYFDFEKLLTG